MPYETQAQKLAAHDAAAAKLLHGVQEPELLAALQALCNYNRELIKDKL